MNEELRWMKCGKCGYEFQFRLIAPKEAVRVHELLPGVVYVLTGGRETQIYCPSCNRATKWRGDW